jgi:glyoxylase-like metal-dependent hydrolase (beta-lactamase superfamily II)
LKEHRRVDNGIEQYVFSLKDHGLDFEMNVTALIDGDKALLIDVGYPEHGEAVRKALEKRDIQVTKIVLSHYHPDHAAGMVAFLEAEVYGSKDYEVNYENCRKWNPEIAYRPVDHILYSGEYLKFGKFRLQCFETPGHSACGMSILIDDRYLHVGDLIMNDQSENSALPLVCKDGGIHAHIKSLEWVKTYADKRLILAHGQSLQTPETIIQAVNKRLVYLKSLVEAYELWHEDAYLEKHLGPWSHAEWHKANIKAAKYIVF